MATPFENFVNTELPKRIGTNESPITPGAGDIPVFTGVGLLTESKTASEAGLATETFATNAANTAETNAKSYADDLIISIYKFQTTYNPQTTGNFPTTANTVGGVAIKKGFTWVVSGVTGQYTFQGVTVNNGDTLLALVDNASATSAADWHITESNLGYTPENQNNKDTDGTLAANSDTKYPSQKAVKTYADTKQAALADVITADTYGSSTQYPVITFNAKGIATGVTLQTVSVAEVSDSVFRIVDNTDATKKIAFEASGITTGQTRTITMPDVDVDLGQMVKGVFTPVELLASANTQNLAPNYSYYLPALYVGALNLAMPVGAAIGTTFDISSIYSTGLDGTSGVNLTALNLAVPDGEYITGWGSATSPINLLVSYETVSSGYRTPNFTQGCTFRLTKTGATSWAIKPTFGSALPKRFIVKNEGSGGTIVNTTVPSGTSKELTLPNADVDLGNVAQAASASSNGYLTSADWSTFNSKLGSADVRYVFLNDSTTTQATYTVPASAVTAAGRTIIELSNNSLTSITVNAATGTGKSVGDSVNISITGTYAAQALVASGVSLQGDLTFSYQYETKTLVYKGSNVWKVVG